MERICLSCIHGWYKFEKDEIQCTESKAPDYNKIVDGHNVCDFHEWR
jgi:hypothetical protein